MTFLIILGIAVVIFIVVKIAVKEMKKKKGIEELLKSDAYALALRIKEKLESKDKIDRQLENNGVQNKYNWSSSFGNDYEYAQIVHVCFYMSLPGTNRTSLLIEASEYKRPIEKSRDWYLNNDSKGYLLENVDNGVSVYVRSYETSKEMLEYVGLAGSVMLEVGSGGGTTPKLYADGKLIG